MAHKQEILLNDIIIAKCFLLWDTHGIMGPTRTAQPYENIATSEPVDRDLLVT
jgi:hypothetical protein